MVVFLCIYLFFLTDSQLTSYEDYWGSVKKEDVVKTTLFKICFVTCPYHTTRHRGARAIEDFYCFFSLTEKCYVVNFSHLLYMYLVIYKARMNEIF